VLSCLPRKKAGEKIRKEAIFSQGIESSSMLECEHYAFFNALLVSAPVSGARNAVNLVVRELRGAAVSSG
jgi:hypothetical protein